MNLTYDWLHETVRARFDSAKDMEAFLPQAHTPAQLAAKADGDYLSAMTQRIFQAGVQHAVVDARWPAFERVFAGFDPQAMAQLSAADIDAAMENKELIRDRAKLQTIPRNARFMLELCEENGTRFGAFIAAWPVTDIIGLWRLLAKRAARLGGRSAAGFLRLAGKDTFFLTSDVVARLMAAEVITRAPSTQRELQAVQAAFNGLHEASGRPLCQLSAMLALSIHPSADPHVTTAREGT